MAQVTYGETRDTLRHWLYRIGGVAALVVMLFFLIGLAGVVATGLQPAAASTPLAPLADNWLVVLFKLSAGFAGVQPDAIGVFSPLDLGLMVLFCLVFVALYLALRRTQRVWSLIATVLPFMGIPLYLVTHMAGRSALLVGGLIMAAVMLRSDSFGKATGYVGVVAGALLFFAGDLGTAIFSSSPIIAVLVAVGYVLWILWFFLIARRLLQLT